MFQQGKKRVYAHNIRLATTLSLIAGIVNVCGVLSVKTLTTNVTGHFAYFAEELVLKNYTNSFAFLIYIVAFLVGAFLSNVLIEFVSRKKPLGSHALPMLIETLVLLYIGLFDNTTALITTNARLIACLMLFAMGIQNSLVTQISQSVVRTTHLTGLFTDLGIELSQLFFYRRGEEQSRLSKSINLKFLIIISFFTGCILGGYVFERIQLRTLLIAAALLVGALVFDNVRFRYNFLKRKFKS